MLTAEYDYATDIAVQREEEREIALQEGMQKGKEEKATHIVLRMVSKDVDMLTISEYTDLSLEEIEKIKSKNKV